MNETPDSSDSSVLGSDSPTYGPDSPFVLETITVSAPGPYPSFPTLLNPSHFQQWLEDGGVFDEFIASLAGKILNEELASAGQFSIVWREKVILKSDDFQPSDNSYRNAAISEIKKTLKGFIHFIRDKEDLFIVFMKPEEGNGCSFYMFPAFSGFSTGSILADVYIGIGIDGLKSEARRGVDAYGDAIAKLQDKIIFRKKNGRYCSSATKKTELHPKVREVLNETDYYKKNRRLLKSANGVLSLIQYAMFVDTVHSAVCEKDPVAVASLSVSAGVFAYQSVRLARQGFTFIQIAKGAASTALRRGNIAALLLDLLLNPPPTNPVYDVDAPLEYAELEKEYRDAREFHRSEGMMAAGKLGKEFAIFFLGKHFYHFERDENEKYELLVDENTLSAMHTAQRLM